MQRPVVQYLYLGLLYALLAWLSIQASRETDNIAIIWLPNAILLGLIMDRPIKSATARALVIIPAGFFANLSFGDSPQMALGLASANLSEVWICLFVLRLFRFDGLILKDLRNFFVFVFAAAGIAVGAGAVIGTAIVNAGTDTAWASIFVGWWFSDSISLLTLTPLVQFFTKNDWRSVTTRLPLDQWTTYFNVALIIGSMAIVSMYESHQIVMLLAPALALIALSVEAIGVLLAGLLILATSVVVFLLTKGGTDALQDAILSLHYLYLESVLPAVVVGIVVGERRRSYEANKKIIEQNRNLIEDQAYRQKQLSSSLSELKAVEAELKKSEQFYRAFYTESPAIVHSIDATGDIMQVSDQWLARFGYSRDEVIGRKSVDFLSEDSRKKATEEILPEFFKTGRCDHVEYQMIHKNGEAVNILLSAIWVNREMEPSHSYAVITDITNIKQAEARALAASAREQEALKRSNQELEQFAYIAAHDLQAPLRHISIYSDMLNQHIVADETENIPEFVDKIAAGTRRMQNLIDDLLAYSRVHVDHEMRRVDCSRIIADIVASQREIESEIDLIVTYGDLPEICGSSSLILRLFENLISNSFKYRSNQTPEVHISATADPSEGWVVFSVSDNGIGIDAKFDKRIFQIFQRLHPRGKYSGTGIGLAICQRIVQIHGGEIWLDKDFSPGTCIKFKLPVWKEGRNAEYFANDTDIRIAGGRM